VAHCALMGGRIQHRLAKNGGSMVIIVPHTVITPNPLLPLWSE